jgi:hypothetical protein
VKVKAPWLKRFRTVSLRISRDGARAAIAVTYHGAAHVFISGVVRSSTGQPLQLTEPIGLIPDLQTVRDLAWEDEDDVVVLGRRQSVPGDRAWVAQIGGDIEPATAGLPGALSVAAGNFDGSVLTGTAKGMYARLGARWEKVTSARWAAFPG